MFMSLEFPSRIWTFKLAGLGIKFSLIYYLINVPKVITNKRGPSSGTIFSPPLLLQCGTETRYSHGTLKILHNCEQTNKMIFLTMEHGDSLLHNKR